MGNLHGLVSFGSPGERAVFFLTGIAAADGLESILEIAADELLAYRAYPQHLMPP
jgi:hypothetical protein